MKELEEEKPLPPPPPPIEPKLPEKTSPPIHKKKLSFSEEVAEISRIVGRDLTVRQMDELKNSRLTRALNKDDDDDLKIHY